MFKTITELLKRGTQKTVKLGKAASLPLLIFYILGFKSTEQGVELGIASAKTGFHGIQAIATEMQRTIMLLFAAMSFFGWMMYSFGGSFPILMFSLTLVALQIYVASYAFAAIAAYKVFKETKLEVSIWKIFQHVLFWDCIFISMTLLVKPWVAGNFVPYVILVLCEGAWFLLDKMRSSVRLAAITLSGVLAIGAFTYLFLPHLAGEEKAPTVQSDLKKVSENIGVGVTNVIAYGSSKFFDLTDGLRHPKKATPTSIDPAKLVPPIPIDTAKLQQKPNDGNLTAKADPLPQANIPTPNGSATTVNAPSTGSYGLVQAPAANSAPSLPQGFTQPFYPPDFQAKAKFCGKPLNGAESFFTVVVKRVLLSPDQTIVEIEWSDPKSQGERASVSNHSRILYGHEIYSVQRSDGVYLDTKENGIPENGLRTALLYFPPLPDGARSFKFKLYDLWNHVYVGTVNV
ncbi:MAG: hypothetical protein WCV50_02075 [Patescibacteria group bacterium]|jgi:hypothetical protein